MQHIAPGTIIASDYWKAYDKLPTINNYTHVTVNHSINFVAPDVTHTNRIESQWRPFKHWVHHHHCGDESQAAAFICEYLFRRIMKKK